MSYGQMGEGMLQKLSVRQKITIDIFDFDLDRSSFEIVLLIWVA